MQKQEVERELDISMSTVKVTRVSDPIRGATCPRLGIYGKWRSEDFLSDVSSSLSSGEYIPKNLSSYIFEARILISMGKTATYIMDSKAELNGGVNVGKAEG
jgi:hypothetical protein